MPATSTDQSDASRPAHPTPVQSRPRGSDRRGLLLLGYQTTRLGSPPDEADRKRDALLQLAHREGLYLVTVFDDDDVNRPCTALASLITAARCEQVSLVGVPTAEDLGLSPHVQRVTRSRIEREAQVRVVIVEGVR